MTNRNSERKNRSNETSAHKKKVPYRRRLRRRRYHFYNFMAACLFAVCLAFLLWDYAHSPIIRLPSGQQLSDLPGFASRPSPILTDNIPQELTKLLKLNEETREFVQNYPCRETYLCQKIDLSGDPELADSLSGGKVPLLMQWDLRWGYSSYGDDMIGLAGCGPVCLSMAYIYLTGDVSLHPAAAAAFAEKNGFCSESGTDWALWTDGVSLLGLTGETLALNESAMKAALDSGGVIICSMRPGDFTTTGHFILIRGYDENGFYVNDPNRRSNSERQWSYEALSHQIKNLWGIWNSTSPAKQSLHPKGITNVSSDSASISTGSS